METIWKYPIPILNRFSIEMPIGSQVLCVQMQRGTPCIWVQCDPEKRKEKKKFRLAGTGHPIEDMPYLYIGTFQMEGCALVFHLFEDWSDATKPPEKNTNVREVIEGVNPRTSRRATKEKRQQLLAKLSKLRSQEAAWMRRLKSAFTRLTNIQEKAKRLEKTLHQLENGQ